MSTDAQRKANAKYQKEHADEFKRIHLRYKRTPENAELIFRLETVGNVNEYIKNLILEDIKKAGH